VADETVRDVQLLVQKQYDASTVIPKCEIIETRAERIVLSSAKETCKKVAAMRVDVSALLFLTYCSVSRNS
jgi:hypothetical protein